MDQFNNSNQYCDAPNNIVQPQPNNLLNDPNIKHNKVAIDPNLPNNISPITIQPHKEEEIIKFVDKDKVSNIFNIFNKNANDEDNLTFKSFISFKNLVKYLVACIDLKPIFFKFINIDKIFYFTFLMTIKYYLQCNYIGLYSLIFRDKLACLTFNKTVYTSTYLIMNNNENNSIPIKALLFYCTNNKIPCVKYITDQNGTITDFDDNIEIKLETNVYLSVKTSSLNNGINYKVEVCSYSKNISYLQKFVSNCVREFRNNKNDDNSSNYILKYYTYYTFNTQNMNPVYEENKFLSNKNFSNIFHPKKNFFIRKVNNFVNGEETYKKLGMPYFLGIILYGDPGTGKTSFIKALAKETNRNIIEIPFSKIKTFKELKSIFSSEKINGTIVPNKKRIYVIEEFDCVIESFKKRNLDNTSQNSIPNQSSNSFHNQLSNHTPKQLSNSLANNVSNQQLNQQPNSDTQLTLDNLLNIIDGTCEPSGYVICITTNFINKIDPALIRAGRFDIRMEFNHASTTTVMEIIYHFSKSKIKCSNIKDFFQDYDHYYKLINKYSYNGTKLIWSPATICQICLYYVDDDNYLEKVIKHIIDNYKSKCTETF